MHLRRPRKLDQCLSCGYKLVWLAEAATSGARRVDMVRWIEIGLVFGLAAVLALASCKTDQDPSPGVHRLSAPVAASPRPDDDETIDMEDADVAFVPEMEQFAREFTGPAPSMTQAEFDAFEREWERSKPWLLRHVADSDLVAISRWAVPQMHGFSLPPDWVEHIPMRPLRTAANGRLVLFSQRAEQSGVLLPSHRGIVHRRLILAAVYNRDAATIRKVYVTIQGWAEE
jgi:hypothetical protein